VCEWYLATYDVKKKGRKKKKRKRRKKERGSIWNGNFKWYWLAIRVRIANQYQLGFIGVDI